MNPPGARFRSTEILFLIYFAYVGVVATWFAIARWPFAWVVLACVGAGFWAISVSAAAFFDRLRDWIPLGLLLLAYRQMDWFTTPRRRTDIEFLWQGWDTKLLVGWHVQAALESAGALIPGVLELCYLLIYAVGPFTVAALYIAKRRERIDRALMLTLGGTLLSYALFPYFPTAPPRLLFAAPTPAVHTALRSLNLWIVNGAGIGSSVFPSAHVSGAFSSAFALILNLPERNRWRWGMLIYAGLVAVATVYGRYHYAADAVAGIGVSLAALALTLWFFPDNSTAR